MKTPAVGVFAPSVTAPTPPVTLRAPAGVMTTVPIAALDAIVPKFKFAPATIAIGARTFAVALPVAVAAWALAA